MGLLASSPSDHVNLIYVLLYLEPMLCSIAIPISMYVVCPICYGVIVVLCVSLSLVFTFLAFSSFAVTEVGHLLYSQ